MVYAIIVITIIVLDLLYLILDSVFGVPKVWNSKNGELENENQRRTAVQGQVVRSGESDVQTSALVIILSILFPIVGIILGCIYIPSYNVTRQRAGKTYLKTSLITIGIAFILYLIIVVLALAPLHRFF